MRFWKEALKLAPPFIGNAATRWGTKKEATALNQFRAWADGVFAVHQCSFDVLRGIDAQGRPLSWIGGSPDGILLPAQRRSEAGSPQQTDGALKPVAGEGDAPLPAAVKATQRWQWGHQQLQHAAEPRAELHDALSRLRVDSSVPAERSAYATLQVESPPASTGRDGQQQESPSCEWPHLRRFSAGRGILEIKCPHSLCAAPARLTLQSPDHQQCLLSALHGAVCTSAIHAGWVCFRLTPPVDTLSACYACLQAQWPAVDEVGGLLPAAGGGQHAGVRRGLCIPDVLDAARRVALLLRARQRVLERGAC